MNAIDRLKKEMKTAIEELDHAVEAGEGLALTIQLNDTVAAVLVDSSVRRLRVRLPVD